MIEISGLQERYPSKFKNLGYRWVPGTEEILEIGYRFVPGISQENVLGTDEYRVPARKNFLVPMGAGYWQNFQRCRPLVMKTNVVETHFLTSTIKEI